jgi:glycosyltransferase involved in cell wall biosynthesis
VSRPIATVVIPAYNAANTIGATVSSVLTQSRGDVEVIVVDDGSVDETVDVIRGFDTSRVALVAQEHGGVACALNAGMLRATAPFVSMLGADDLWLPSYLNRMMTALEANPQSAVAYTDAWLLDDVNGRIARASAMQKQRPRGHASLNQWEFFCALMQRNFVFSSTLARKEVLANLGFCDPGLRSAEDYDLWLRAAMAGHEFVYVPGRLVVYRVRPDSLSRKSIDLHEDMIVVYRKIAASHDASPRARELARSRLRTTGGQLEASLDRRRAPRQGGDLAVHARRIKRWIFQPFRWYWRPPRRLRSAFPELERQWR